MLHQPLPALLKTAVLVRMQTCDSDQPPCTAIAAAAVLLLLSIHTYSDSLERSVEIDHWGHTSAQQQQQQRTDTALGRYSPDALATPQHIHDQSSPGATAAAGSSSMQAAAAAGAKHHPKLTAQLLRQAQAELQQRHGDSPGQHYAQLQEEFLGMGGASFAPSVGGQTDRDRHELISTESDDESDA
jgi:hypothetical protein